MAWHESDDVEQYLAAAGDLLLAEPGVHTISLTVCANVRARPDGTRFAWWQEADGEVTGCVSRTPPYPVVVGALPEHALAPLLDLWDVDAVNAPTQLATQVAAAASRRCGRTAHLKTAERLFRLGDLTPPSTPGKARGATDGDVDLLVRWFDAFVEEARVLPQDTRAAVLDRLGYGGYVLWEDEGQPVALAGHTRKAFEGMRIGPVYTPPEHRGRGYGGAVTAAASRKCLDEGAREVVLFTDLTNPTSNALYPRLGYRPVTDRAVFLMPEPSVGVPPQP